MQSPWAEDPTHVAARLEVAPSIGLTTAEAVARRARFGPNRLAEAPTRSGWALLLDQFRNLLVVVLLAAAVLAGLVGDLADALVIFVVLVFNAILGFVQEHRAERSLAALKNMLEAVARVRRDGLVEEVVADQLVPGDVVLLEAGNRVPADGRLLVSAALEVDESTLTGESSSVAKSVEPLSDVEAPLAERSNMLFMNTVLTRGRAELLVTATGMGTEIGKLADMLQHAVEGPTPLQHQLDELGKRLGLLAGAAVVVFLALGLVRGETVANTLLSAVALAVAAIPEGLPAVVTVTLAVGTHQLAKRGAIVKRLASVETLGSTSVICSDKTGTLTLNQMTAKAVITAERAYEVSGEGYRPDGKIVPAAHVDAPDPQRPPLIADDHPVDLRRVMVVSTLCNDSYVDDDGRLMGDPTEGALVTLARKGGLDVAREREGWPRLGEIPFDAGRKYMATVHREDGLHPDRGELRVFVKGALEALLPYSEASGEERSRWLAEMELLAGRGLRVLAVGEGRATEGFTQPCGLEQTGDPLVEVKDLRLLGLIGLLDPPRPEARAAIEVCARAGVAVKMITGDHATTAGAIARALGLSGKAVTGSDLDHMDDDELVERLDEIAVFARVAPEHKVRIVRALRQCGHVVAMTGDGVNDAPALKTADIGVAMGITGTEVSKEAASMVLTDDNFATIVRAVEGGRTIYANIVKFVRFQLSTNMGAILSLVGAQLAGLPVPFSAIQVLWVNLIMDGPPAMALGVDPPSQATMVEPPRQRSQRILTPRRLAGVLSHGAVMAAGTLGVLAYGLGTGSEEHALALAFTTFVLFQVFNVFNARAERATVFSRDSLRNPKLLVALAVVVVLQVLAVHVDPVQAVFGTADFAPVDWALAVVVASSVLVLEELRKLVLRVTRFSRVATDG